MFRKGRREGRGTYAFANGAVYEGRFRDDAIDGMGTFNLPSAVFMPESSKCNTSKITAPTSSTNLSLSSPSSASLSGAGENTKANSDESMENKTDLLPGDAWMVPINLSQDIGTIHFLAGFDKEGM